MCWLYKRFIVGGEIGEGKIRSGRRRRRGKWDSEKSIVSKWWRTKWGHSVWVIAMLKTFEQIAPKQFSPPDVEFIKFMQARTVPQLLWDHFYYLIFGDVSIAETALPGRLLSIQHRGVTIRWKIFLGGRKDKLKLHWILFSSLALSLSLSYLIARGISRGKCPFNSTRQ